MPPVAEDPSPTPLVRLRGVTKHFVLPRETLVSRKPVLQALDRVDLDIGRRQTVGVVGESGCGKSTLARIVTKLHDASAGSYHFDGENLTAHRRAGRLTAFRRDVQMVFQDPFASFDPTSSVGSSLVESLRAQDRLGRAARRSRAEELLDMVGLRASFADRRPNELSGGQLQRAAIARALSTNPRLVVLDEPVSALDLSTQGQVINLLEDLQREFGMSYLLVAHDLAVVQHASDQIVVMHLGQAVEYGPATEVFQRPRHPYTVSLLSATPAARPQDRDRERLVLQGDLPSPLKPPSGCRFRTRCPWAMDICSVEDPAAFTTPEGTLVRCHLHTHGPRLGGAPLAGTPAPSLTPPGPSS